MEPKSNLHPTQIFFWLLLKKTKKTPLMMSEAFGPTCCSFGLVSESKLSHCPKAQYGFVPKLSHHAGNKHRLFKPKKHFCNTQFLVERSETVFLPLKMSYIA